MSWRKRNTNNIYISDRKVPCEAKEEWYLYDKDEDYLMCVSTKKILGPFFVIETRPVCTVIVVEFHILYL